MLPDLIFTLPRGYRRQLGMESALPRCFLRTPRRRPALWLCAWLAAGVTTGGPVACAPRAGGGPGSPRPSASAGSKEPPAVNTGLAALASNSKAVVLPTPDPTAPMTEAQKAVWAQQSALNLEQLLRDGTVDDFGRPKTPPPAQAPTTPAARPQPVRPRGDGAASTGLGALAAESGAETGKDAVPEAAPTEPVVASQQQQPAAGPPASPVTDLAARMASLLRPAPGKSKAALSDSAALLPIEAMQPGVLATLDDAANPLAASLAQADLATLRQARTRLMADSTTPPDLLTALRGSAAPVVPAPRQFSITRSALCTRVTGFGRFDPYSSSTFVAGRPIRAIVYTELDGFATRPARSGDPVQTSVAMGDQVSVQLSQTLSLYNDKDGLLAWHRPAQGVTETSRSARRDFYLIQIIELPPTLSIGRYNLKVTVADSTSGNEAESILPIDVVADPSLVSRSR